ncbi:4-hydroxy-tetrahydrodipicolinate synthase [Paraburkholderia bannensis]|uniref:4-hydroxy-tetrahydrodipicolinate synthase n=1 Tax=Paraburkholderia bannensis TaxID=765414 RepID=A0A7W9U4R9_9BURK|nr:MULTISPECIES: 4-hydroxy-tetrahydrodipicolinate synthase [Paraburkholderia]MBB3260898.1 4-hydroxy-tetrahydrodipicolinate synthase [Paraburkholderia sp. WP4_3_2]MBB6105935.1 4-hydroxy-tetrahydrodipicolinate synthase [Paraburkholderia bannensis]
MSSFSGIWIPLVTPFSGGAVDHDALDVLVRRYVRAGVAGFVALGTTGEPAALDVREQDAVFATVLGAAGALPVVAGVSGNHTQSVCERIAALNDTPVAGVLAAAPYYIRPSQTGVIGHFTALADASRKPVILYDIPARTGVALALPTLLELAGHERIVAVKDCGGSLDKTLALILDGRLQVLCGEDLDMFGMMCAGASGAIAASAHVLPERFVAMERALREGRLDEARALWHTLVPLVRAMFAEPNPGPVKAALARHGLLRNELRAPMMRVSDELEETLDKLLA